MNGSSPFWCHVSCVGPAQVQVGHNRVDDPAAEFASVKGALQRMVAVRRIPHPTRGFHANKDWDNINSWQPGNRMAAVLARSDEARARMDACAARREKQHDRNMAKLEASIEGKMRRLGGGNVPGLSLPKGRRRASGGARTTRGRGCGGGGGGGIFQLTEGDVAISETEIPLTARF